MGYTHYWRHTGPLPEDKFKAFFADCEQLLDPKKVAAALGEDIPLNRDDCGHPKAVVFNGVGADSYETFLFTPVGRGFAFCKTAHRPYDVLVTACLLTAIHHFGDAVEVSSDGRSEEWEEGRELCRKVLGYVGKWPARAGERDE